MNVGLSKEFQQAFRTVTGMEPTPGNVISAMQNDERLTAAIHEELMRLLNSKPRAANDDEPEGGGAA